MFIGRLWDCLLWLGGRCPFWRRCRFYERGACTCNDTRGEYYGPYQLAGCALQEMERQRAYQRDKYRREHGVPSPRDKGEGEFVSKAWFRLFMQDTINEFDKKKSNYSGADVRKILRRRMKECDLEFVDSKASNPRKDCSEVSE